MIFWGACRAEVQVEGLSLWGLEGLKASALGLSSFRLEGSRNRVPERRSDKESQRQTHEKSKGMLVLPPHLSQDDVQCLALAYQVYS